MVAKREFHGGDRKRSSLFVLQLVLLCFAAIISFSTAIPGEMVWVDGVEITEAGYRITSWQDFQDVWRMPLDEFIFRHDGNISAKGGYWRPLLAIELTLHWWLFGANTAAWHVGNLLWHVGVVVVLFHLGRRWCQDPSGWVAFCAALLFAVHPLGVHSVAWISGRKDLMCAAFGGLSMLAFERVAESRRTYGWLAAGLMAMLLSIGCKELGFCVPIMASALVVCRWTDAKTTRQPLAAAIMIGFAGLVFVYRRWALGAFGLDVDYPADNVLGNLLTAAQLNCHYLGRVGFPWQPQISDRWAVANRLGVAEAFALASVVTIGMLTAWAVVRRSAFAVPMVWYVVWMLPACGLVPLQHVRAERYLYPASWGLLLWICMAVSQLNVNRRMAQRVAWTAAVVAAALGCLHSRAESRFWRSDRALFKEAIRRDPDYLEGHVALAADALQRQELDGAMYYSEIAIALADVKTQTGYWSPFIARSNYGLALYYVGRFPQAREQFRLAQALRPQSAKTAYHLGLVAMAMGDISAAEGHFLGSLDSQSDFLTRSNLAFVWMQQNKLDRARELLQQLVVERPADATNRRNLASVHFAQQNFAEARAIFTALVEHSFQPIDAAKLSYCFAKEGDFEQARGMIERALRADPQDIVVRRLAEAVAAVLREAVSGDGTR